MKLPGSIQELLRPANIPAALALLVVVLAGFYADHQNRIVFRQEMRSGVAARIDLIREKIEGSITADLQLARGLVTVIAAEPEIGQEKFAGLGRKLLEERSHLRLVAGAPNLVVSMVYPVEGNESVLGLDYRQNPDQRSAVLRARHSGELVIAGPLALVQGGHGLVARFPVFVDRPDGFRTFWGNLSAVIDIEQTYRDSGLLDPDLGLDVAIVGKDGLGAAGAQFYGPEIGSLADPVTTDVILPSGSWHLAAVPKGGWNVLPDNLWLIRLGTVLAGAIIAVPILVSGRLLEERQRHIRRLRSRETELQRLSRRLGLALETSRIGVWEFDIVTNELFWDDRMNEIYGLPTDGGARDYRHWHSALHPVDLARAQEDFRRAVEETGVYHSEYRVVTPRGEVRSIRAIGAVYRDPGTTAKIVGVNWDVSADVALNEDLKRAKSQTEARNRELEAAKAEIEHNSLHDSLTGLANRRYLDLLLERDAQAGPTDHCGLALLHIDLDRFKQINDTLGHAAGDAMLVHASEVLKRSVRQEDFVARIGGDEFVIACRLEPGAAEPTALAERLISEMRRPVFYQGHECRFGVSVGIAARRGPEVDGKQLLVNADIALYRAKSRGRNRFEVFSAELQEELVTTKRTADEILAGLEQHQFVPFFQPQFDARSLALVGIEALARWHHPVRGIVAPDAFLEIAEDLNVVATIDCMVLEQALAQLRDWNARGLAVPRISVNVSARRLHDESLVESLRRLSIEPGTVSFELVESIYLDEGDLTVTANIEQLKGLGIDIEIDDFGTGYASIVSLMKLRPRRLKIDRELVMPIASSDAQRNLVGSMIEIGKTLGIEVVAEGVETLEHATILRELGCDILQGYAFARPLSARDLSDLLRSRPITPPGQATPALARA